MGMNAPQESDDPKDRVLRFLLSALSGLNNWGTSADPTFAAQATEMRAKRAAPVTGAEPAGLLGLQDPDRAAWGAQSGATPGGLLGMFGDAPPSVSGGVTGRAPASLTGGVGSGPADLAARQEREAEAERLRMGGPQRTALEKAQTERARLLRETPQEVLAEARAAGRSIGPPLTPETIVGPTALKGGKYGVDMAGKTRDIGPGAVSGGGTVQGASGVNAAIEDRSGPRSMTLYTPPVANITGNEVPSTLDQKRTLANIDKLTGVATTAGTSKAPDSLTGLPSLGSLDRTLLETAGKEGTLAQYMANPEFAVHDMLTDAGANPDTNIYARYAKQKWAPIFKAMGQISEVAAGEGATDAYQNFLRTWAGGGDMTPAIKAAIARASGTTPDAIAAREQLDSISPEEWGRIISATRGESPWAAQTRARSMSIARTEQMRAAQERAQKGDLSDSDRAWLEYLLGQVG
jgi:hypothetical protein